VRTAGPTVAPPSPHFSRCRPGRFGIAHRRPLRDPCDAISPAKPGRISNYRITLQELPSPRGGRRGPADAIPIGHYVRVEEAIPILRVADAETSVAWYERLGYEKEWEHRFEPSFPAFVSLARDGTSRLFLSEHSRDAGGPLVAGMVVYIRVDDVDAIAKQFDAEIVEMPWAREVCLTDPDGNRLRIGTPNT
jgi:catechol 2,3-dioxygenase-like lactoylglutathione lyase family enzyme